MGDPSAPLSWRDVYRAVSESETRIVAAIREATVPIATTQADHETRLRKLEMEGSSVAHDAKRSVDALWIKQEALKAQVEAMIATKEGAFTTVGIGKQIIIIAMAMMGTAIAVAEFIK
jgi:hypothetical protein